jgi:protein TonB
MDTTAFRQFTRLVLLGLTLVLTGALALGAERVPTAAAMAAAITKPAPAMPPLARQYKISGEVRVDVTIGVEGGVEGCEVLSGNPILAKAAQDAVKKWKFKPIEQDDKAIQAMATLSFSFK